MSETHEVFWIHTGPQYFGWPCKRMRMFCFCINKKTLKYVGPTDYRKAFASRFYSMCQLTGAELFCAPDEDRYKYYQELARGQGHDVSAETIASMPLRKLLPCLMAPSYVGIAEEHTRNLETLQSPGGTYIADLHHHPGARGSSPGADFPSQLCHGMVAAFESGGDRCVLTW